MNIGNIYFVLLYNKINQTQKEKKNISDLQ